MAKLKTSGEKLKDQSFLLVYCSFTLCVFSFKFL